MADRTIHGYTGDGGQIVRYNRAGKWYVERDDRPRERVSVDDAALLATRRGAQAILGRTGGRTFDAAVRSAGSGWW